jgi:HD-GYP domain-containing protein (c-di-GMP phosphodiesterase class II)
MLHDVGKLSIPGEILNKPGPLSPEERAIVNTHTIRGQRLLQRVGAGSRRSGVLSGPATSTGTEPAIPTGLRAARFSSWHGIVSCCDAFSALTTDRSYRRARSVAASLDELEACAGSQFDPEVVRVLTDLIRSGRAGLERPPQLVAVAARA